MRRRPAFLAAVLVLCTVAIAQLQINTWGGSPAVELTVNSSANETRTDVDSTAATNHTPIANTMGEHHAADQKEKLTISQPKNILPPDPLLQQLEAMPYEQQVHIPIDMKVLAKPPIR
jgi:hypothetical protein